MPRLLPTICAFAGLMAVVCVPAWAQQTPVPDRRDANRTRIRSTVHSVDAEERAEALRWAVARQLPVAVRQRNGRRVLLVGVDDGRRPRYLASWNGTAARVTQTLALHPGQELGLALTGAGMEIGLWDEGTPRTDHQELVARVVLRDPAVEDNHATHVAGTLAGAGVLANARGMAYEAGIRAYDWENDTSEMTTEGERGLLLSNHSYGLIAGWYYGDLEDTGDAWYWLGDPDVSMSEDYLFGWYDVDAAQFDRVANAEPYLLPVVAAGNDRSDFGPHEGTYRALNERGDWQSFDVASTPRSSDGGVHGYDTIAGAGVAKNVLTVGAVELVTPFEVGVSAFSSFGPTDDGRVKPDLVGYGNQVYSALATGTDAYGFASGTSMSTPNVAGSLTLLQQLIHDETGRYARAAALKGLAIHTARDVGRDGPDYQYGWGLLDAEQAARHILDLPKNELHLVEATLLEGATYTQSATVEVSGPVWATLSWTDPTSSRLPVRGAESLDDPDPHLRNDLDIRLRHEESGTVYLPYTLNRLTPDAIAVPGDNTVDPVEQVFIPNAPAGRYSVLVTHKGALDGGAPQPFALLVSGAQGAVRPVAVSHLSLEETSSGVVLGWRTQFETVAGTFDIRRAPLAVGSGGVVSPGAYTTVGAVPGLGTTEAVQTYSFSDRTAGPGRYRYQVHFRHGDEAFLTGEIDALVPAPGAYGLLANYPNPFRGTTTLTVELPQAHPATVAVYDVLGRRVALLHDGILAAGRHPFQIDAGSWAPGVYVAHLVTPTVARSLHMVVVP